MLTVTMPNCVAVGVGVAVRVAVAVTEGPFARRGLLRLRLFLQINFICAEQNIAYSPLRLEQWRPNGPVQGRATTRGDMHDDPFGTDPEDCG